MGQYHKLYNPDKKEFVAGNRLGNGLKLMEQCGFEESTATALWLLVANSNGRGGGDAVPHPMIGRWAGDRIVVQGDYAEKDDQGFVELEQEPWTDISDRVQAMLKIQDS